MTFIVFDHGLRTHTPWYDIFPPKDVEQLSPTLRVKPLASDDENKESRTPEKRDLSLLYRENKAQTNRMPLVQASQIMSSPAISINESLSVLETWDQFTRHNFRHLSVTNDKHQLVGIISDRDVLLASSRLSSKEVLRPGKTPISEIMRRRVLSAQVSTSIRHLAMAICNHHIGALPIVNPDNQVVGMVTRSDILGAIINEAPLELWA